MSTFALALAYLRHRPLATLLHGLLLALGVAMIVVLLLFARQAEDKLARDARGIDLVIGAKGSPMQLILASIYHVDVPTGNIALADAELILADPMVKRAIPLALGDSYRGYRITGTSPALAELYAAPMASGRFWAQPLEAVLGAEVARATGLGLGAEFIGSHGLTGGGAAHADTPYRVVGVLEPTGSAIDKLILTSVESVWKVHEGHASAPQLADIMAKMMDSSPAKPASSTPSKPATPAKPAAASKPADHDHADHDDHEHGPNQGGREVTAYLVQYATPLAAAIFPRMVNAQSSLQAAQPAYETARLLKMLGLGIDTLRVFALVLIGAAALSLFVALTHALDSRRADLAVLRVLGASPARLLGLVLAEGLALTLGGVILGLALGHLGAELLGAAQTELRQLNFSGFVWVNEEWLLVAGVLGLGVAAALVPAIAAYRQDMSSALLQR